MAPERWLDELPQTRDRAADDDLSILCAQAYPFLSDQAVRRQITRLSGHLAGLADAMRRRVIAYSLYVRQLDVIQAAATRDFCRDDCMRPPVGCCNANHFQILSLADVMVARPSQTAMELAHIIGMLQRQETAFELDAGRSLTTGHCDCLASDGCTLRLFKSPRCVHYLCPGLGDDLTERFGPQTARFLDAMHVTAVQTIASTADFTDPAILDAAGAFLSPPAC
jgi:transposase-like protein